MIVLRGLVIGLSTLFVFLSVYYTNGNLVLARTATFATLVFSQLVHVFECKSEEKSVFELPIWNNLYLMGAVFCSAMMLLAVIYIPALRGIFQTCPLGQREWLLVAGFALLGPCCNGLNRLLGRCVRNVKRFFNSIFRFSR